MNKDQYVSKQIYNGNQKLENSNEYIINSNAIYSSYSYDLN